MDWDDRRTALRQAFTPAQPVGNTDLFAGRTAQLLRVVETFESPGEHAAIFGERGVGKTSLASIAEIAVGLRGSFALRLNCQANDDDVDIWRRLGETVARKVRLEQARKTHPQSPFHELAPGATQLLTGGMPSSNDVLTALEILGQGGPVGVILDEFDRLGESRLHSALVDLMKTVADIGLDITFVVVGVASTVDGLIDEHESIGRGLNEIEMPRMSRSELLDILDRGLTQAEMTIVANAAELIAGLSRGLPHYVHLMGLHAGLVAVERQAEQVTAEDVLLSLGAALARAQQHVSRLYFEATHSTRKNMFKEVLLGAALAGSDERGFFAPGDMRAAMSHILGRDVEIPTFSKQLIQFSDERGPVLERSSAGSRPRYRFTEPLLVPYVAMRGLADGAIEAADLRRLGEVS